MNAASFVPLSGLYTEAGPVLGVQLDASGGGVPLVLDYGDNTARMVEADEVITDPLRAAPPPKPTFYVVVSKRTGQAGQGRYVSAVMAALAMTARRDYPDYMLATMTEDGEKVEPLQPDEKQSINEFLTSVGLSERVLP